MIVRRALVLIAAALLVAIVVRNAAVMMLAQSSPAEAAGIWRTHPAAEISLAMTEIARAARDRRPIPPSAFAMVGDAATKDPLAPEPFLVRGVQAQLAGNGALAERAFEAAQWRDPRSLPAAYFLADHYVREGDIGRGLSQIAALARLSPNGATTAGPYIAAFAANSANWPVLRKVFKRNPELAGPALNALASNIATVPAVLALADSNAKPSQAQWLAPLLATLTEAGQYAKARAIWAKASGARIDEPIHDARFTDKVAPPPFNWSLTSSAVGLAERQPGGRLHILFYGQEDGILATQLLLLKPGPYRLTMQLIGDRARARSLNWSIWCDKAPAPIASVTLEAAASRGWSFNVPAGCPAQWLKLSGSSGDISQQVDETIGGLKLERMAGA
ncbi:MAG TPA: hypothetical protein VJT70_01970 [Sphingomicrobium sp.]|nr:hypothetical protein [Sphingomicrobium sp.]